MEKIHAIITGVGGYVPEYVLNNEELSHMVDTNDEWIMTRIGIKERRILKEDGLGTSYLGGKAVDELLKKTGADPDSIDAVLFATCTPDYAFPSTASLVCKHAGIHHAMAMDLEAACSGFLFAMDTASCMIESGRYKKIIVIGGDKLSSIVNYKDRATCPIFGDGAGAVLVEPTTEDLGWMDSYLRADGESYPYLRQEAGGSACPASHETVERGAHYLFQDGRHVFKCAVTDMGEAVSTIAERNKLDKNNIAWVIPHQANYRIIKALAERLELPMDHVMINIQRYGNTSSGTLPLCLWEYEKQLKKGDNLIFTAFGAGFTWGAAYMKWGYNGQDK